jgi:hypothetical protein
MHSKIRENLTNSPRSEKEVFGRKTFFSLFLLAASSSSSFFFFIFRLFMCLRFLRFCCSWCLLLAL